MLGPLCEAYTGVQQQAVPCDTVADRSFDPPLQFPRDLGCHVAIVCVRIHVVRPAAHMHQHGGDAASGDQRAHLRVVLQAADVVDQRHSLIEREVSDLRLGGVNRERHPGSAGDGPQHGVEPRELFRGADRRRARPRGLRADVNQVRRLRPRSRARERSPSPDRRRGHRQKTNCR